MIRNGRRDVADDLARAYGNRGSTYLALQQLTNALADYNRFIDMWDTFDNHRQPEQTTDLAERLISRASVVLQFNQLSNYMADCSRAISLLEPLAEAQPGSLKVLGIALCYRANGYDHLMDLTNAIKDYTRSISILSTFAANGQHDVIESLVKASFNCANDYKVVGGLTNSIQYYSRAIGILDQSTENTPELKAHLATIVKCRALTYCACGEITNAVLDCRRFETMMQYSVERNGAASLSPDLEQSLVMLSVVLTIDNKADEAKPYLEKAIKLNTDQKCTHFAILLLQAQTRPDASQLQKMLMDALQKRSP